MKPTFCEKQSGLECNLTGDKQGGATMRKRKDSQDSKLKDKSSNRDPDYHLKYSVTNSSDSDGSWTSESVFGKVTYNGTGAVKAQLGDIAGISLGNISGLSSYQIEEGTAAISHSMKFRNGGSCRLTYRKTGEIIEFTVNRVRINVTPEKVVIICPL